jgi:hypothetical protein
VVAWIGDGTTSSPRSSGTFGEHRVPTWVLALVLAAMVAAIAALVLLG